MMTKAIVTDKRFVGRMLILVCVGLCVLSLPTRASELTRGRKALFREDFESDIMEWTVFEKGETADEDPFFKRTDEAYEGNNALFFRGRKGILGLELTEKLAGLVEFQVKFPAPHDYTRLFAVGTADGEVLMGLNASDRFAWSPDGGRVHTSSIPVDENWHTFTFDFSGSVPRGYIDGQLVVAGYEGMRAFDRVRLGVGKERGGLCLVDDFALYEAEAGLEGLSEEEALIVTVPLTGWEGDLKPARESCDDRDYPTCTYGVSDEVAHSGQKSAVITYRSASEGERAEYAWGTPGRYHLRFYRSVPLFGAPRKLSVWVHGDGSRSELQLLLYTPAFKSQTTLQKIDWTGWRQLSFTLPRDVTPGSYLRAVEIQTPLGKSGAIYSKPLSGRAAPYTWTTWPWRPGLTGILPTSFTRRTPLRITLWKPAVGRASGCWWATTQRKRSYSP